MGIIQIGVAGIICVVLVMSLRKESPQIALLLSLAGGLLILFNAADSLGDVIESVKRLTEDTTVSFKYAAMVIKVVGISYIAEFCSQLCIDAGESAIASKIELGAKIFIIAASFPIISGLIETVNSLLA